jgi:2-polyprenyl-6-methoxyphenol hydroxylase-like FAD-dependent oxidoreductase
MNVAATLHAVAETKVKVIIVGGGIGGLSLALSLHQAGIECDIFESAPTVEFVGLGICLQPDAVRELSGLRLKKDIEQVALRIEELSAFNSRGELIWSEPRGEAAGHRWPQYSISRGALQKILIGAVKARLGEDHLRLGHHLASFQQKKDKIAAVFIDRNTGEEIACCEGDVLVGADGVNSAVRRMYYPEDRLRFDGIVNFRGVLLMEPFLSGKTMVLIGGREQRLTAFGIMGPEATEGGRVLVNWICTLRMNHDVMPLAEWGREADRTKFYGRYADWAFSWLDVPKLIRLTQHVWEFPDIDREPIPQWSFGRVTLLGDAAHPMLPVVPEAGSQAIVDGIILSETLAEFSDPVEALRNYQARRIGVTNRMTLRHRNLGPANYSVYQPHL